MRLLEILFTFTLPDSICYPEKSDSKYPYNGTGDREFLEGVPFLEPFVVVPAMAAVTSKIRFTTSVMKLAIRQPVIVAKQLSSVAFLTNNRFVFGVGISPWPDACAACPRPPPRLWAAEAATLRAEPAALRTSHTVRTAARGLCTWRLLPPPPPPPPVCRVHAVEARLHRIPEDTVSLVPRGYLGRGALLDKHRAQERGGGVAAAQCSVVLLEEGSRIQPRADHLWLFDWGRPHRRQPLVDL